MTSVHQPKLIHSQISSKVDQPSTIVLTPKSKISSCLVFESKTLSNVKPASSILFPRSKSISMRTDHLSRVQLQSASKWILHSKHNQGQIQPRDRFDSGIGGKGDGQRVTGNLGLTQRRGILHRNRRSGLIIIYTFLTPRFNLHAIHRSEPGFSIHSTSQHDNKEHTDIRPRISTIR